MPKGVYPRKRKPTGTAMPVPPMPHKHGKWRAASQKSWAAWFTSGRASLLDDAGIVALERVTRLADDADRKGWPLDLTREVRLQEAALLARVAPSALRSSATTNADDRRAISRADDPEHPSNWTELSGGDVAKCELAPLVADGLDFSTPAGRRAAIAAYDEATQRGLSVLG